MKDHHHRVRQYFQTQAGTYHVHSMIYHINLLLCRGKELHAVNPKKRKKGEWFVLQIGIFDKGSLTSLNKL